MTKFEALVDRLISEASRNNEMDNRRNLADAREKVLAYVRELEKRRRKP